MMYLGTFSRKRPKRFTLFPCILAYDLFCKVQNVQIIHNGSVTQPQVLDRSRLLPVKTTPTGTFITLLFRLAVKIQDSLPNQKV